MRLLLALCIASTAPSGLAAQTYITKCVRDGRHVYCSQRPYVKQRVPQPERRQEYLRRKK